MVGKILHLFKVQSLYIKINTYAIFIAIRFLGLAVRLPAARRKKGRGGTAILPIGR